MTNNLFVYGTLKTKFNNPAALFLRNNSSFQCTGYVFGELYEIAGYPGLIIKKNNKEEKVFGEIYTLNNPSYVLNHLDKYEEINILNGNGEFKRERTAVYTPYGKINCWVYLYNSPIEGLKRIPDGNY